MSRRVREGGVAHALLVPTSWMFVDAVPVARDQQGPQVGSLFVEDPELEHDSAVIVCGSAPSGYGDGPRQVLERLAEREGQAVYRWGQDDAAGARAMASDDLRVAALRVMPHRDRWVFVWGMGPNRRLVQFGEAFKEAVGSYETTRGWALDQGR